MTSAILEILFLLAVSCLIGIFFTRRYWKSRYADVQSQLREQWATIGSLKANQKDTQSKIADLEAQLEEAKKGTDDNSVAALETEQQKNTALKAELDEAKSKLREKKKNVSAKKEKKEASPKPDDTEVKELHHQIELINEELNEKEREIESLSEELSNSKISYYKQIDGKRYKAITLKFADESVAGKGDGRISVQDAKKIFATISDGTAYTQVEKHTMRYLRDNYNWTDGADKLFRKKVRSWAAKGHHLD